MKSWPQPNKHGVYNAADAESFQFENRYLWMVGHILQLKENEWLGVASFSIKMQTENTRTMGCRSPLSSSRYNPVRASREEALDAMRQQLYGFIENGKKEARSKLASRTWSAALCWAFHIEKQLELFD